MRALFDGGARGSRQEAYRAVVVANAAAALKLAGRAPDWPAAIAVAEAMLDGGAARDCLTRFVAFR